MVVLKSLLGHPPQQCGLCALHTKLALERRPQDPQIWDLGLGRRLHPNWTWVLSQEQESHRSPRQPSASVPPTKVAVALNLSAASRCV